LQKEELYNLKQREIWKFKHSRTLRRIHWQRFTDVSKYRTAFIFRAKQSKKSR